jgi:hypothetical protein
MEGVYVIFGLLFIFLLFLDNDYQFFGGKELVTYIMQTKWRNDMTIKPNV